MIDVRSFVALEMSLSEPPIQRDQPAAELTVTPLLLLARRNDDKRS